MESMNVSSPTLELDPKVEHVGYTQDNRCLQIRELFEKCFGHDRWESVLESLSRPSLKTTLRVNTTQSTCQEVIEKLPGSLRRFRPFVDPDVPGVVTFHGQGPCSLKVPTDSVMWKDVLITRKTGEAVLRGADVFTPGVLATSPGLEKGDTVVVSIYLGGRTVTRGTILADENRIPGKEKFRIGVGVSQMSRTELFRNLHGVAVLMRETLYSCPPCNGILQGQVMLQNLPSIVAAQVMDPRPGWRVLDMCAAPGGKTTAMAELMQDHGEITALDRTHKKAALIQSLASELGLSCITVYKMDATKALLQKQNPSQTQQKKQQGTKDAAREARKAATRLRCKQAAPAEAVSTPKCDGFDEASFDGVLLDAPCSALGLRPRLHFPHIFQELQETAHYQRRLLDTAVKLVKSGGSLVYSTCTINPGENEANVRYVLDSYRSLSLHPQKPYLGSPGLVGTGLLTEAEAPLVQRFYPDGALDTIGFFIAKFLKT